MDETVLATSQTATHGSRTLDRDVSPIERPKSLAVLEGITAHVDIAAQICDRLVETVLFL